MCVSILVFSMLRLIPGDPVDLLAGESATDEEKAILRESLGLDKPLYEQYFIWLSRALHGDLGYSFWSRMRVLQLCISRFLNTLALTAVGMTFSVSVGVLTGIASATKRGTAFDKLSRVVALTGVSMPPFLLGLLLIWIFSVYLNILPTGGTGGVANVVLPGITIGSTATAVISRMTRSNMLEVIPQDYIRTARAKGCSERRVIYKHALRNVLIPIVTVSGLQLSLMMAGAVVTETVFSYPGIGKLIVASIFTRDYAVVQGAVLITATAIVVVNVLTDVIYWYLDPRVRNAL